MGGGPGGDIHVRPGEHGALSSAASSAMETARGTITDVTGLRADHAAAVNQHTKAGRDTLTSGQKLGAQAAKGAQGLGHTDEHNAGRFSGPGS